MTTRYVGKGGSDSNNGLSWATRKLTLNGVEDTPVQAGDTVYVGAGTYRETLTVDVSGSSGSPITYIGDYTGANTDGIGGVVRITGSDNDTTQTRADCITATSKNYRTFRGFLLDGSNSTFNITGSTNWTIDQCFHARNGNRGITITGASSSITISNNYFVGGTYRHINFEHTSFVSNANILIQNCIFNGNAGRESNGVTIIRYGGVIIKNCYFNSIQIGVNVATIPDTGQTITVNNCVLNSCFIGLRSATAGYLIENYNNIVSCENARSNVDVGAQSLTYIMLPDSRWFFEMVNGGSMLTPFDLASYSGLINVAGTSPTTADMRGTTVQGTQREWGALEYDSTLDIEAGSGGGGLLTNPGMTGGMRG